MSRQSSNMSRPSSGGSSRPSTGGGRSPSRPTATPPSPSRLNTGSRPTTGTRPSTRPGAGSTPSAGSRPEPGSRPGSGSTRPGGSGRPSQGQLSDFLDLPKAGGGTPGSGSGPSNRGSDFLQSRPSERPSEGPGGRPEQPRLGEGPAGQNRPDRLDDRQDQRSDRFDQRTDQQLDRRDNAIDNRQDQRDRLADNRADRIDNVDQHRAVRLDRRNEVRQQVRRNPPGNDFWRKNRYARRWTHPYRWATWGSVVAWFPWGWSQPISYSYGDNVYVQGDTVYYGEEAVGTQQEYSEQAFAIASSANEVAPDDSADDSQWMSLGVFAMTQDGQASGPEPNLFVQLAVSKEGMIAGTYFNSSTNQSHEIEGAVDKQTQRTAWTVGSNDWPVMETGISNLTEDEAPALIHFENGQSQQWLLVRLEDPGAE